MRRRLGRLALIALALLAALAVWIVAGLPSRSEVRALAKTNPGKTRLMEQREAEARARKRRARIVQRSVPLAAVSRHLIHAVLAAEDQKFFGHEGVDWKAIQESIEKDVKKRRFARGGSTITQQLAKNLYFGTAKTPVRKLRELVVAWWLEEDLSKARILGLYLNVIEWGDGIYGCEAAARHWYGKPAAALSEVEAAGLAAMIPNPRRLNPRVSAARHQRATRRVLWLMAQAGYIGRDVAGLGAEPPPVEVAEDEASDIPPEPDATDVLEPLLEPVPLDPLGLPEATPPGGPAPSPDQPPTAEPTPSPEPTPPPA
jgi:monofunctional biosynthetic peptidoglycan transglycosylase